jgi:hypothetical protein
MDSLGREEGKRLEATGFVLIVEFLGMARVSNVSPSHLISGI